MKRKFSCILLSLLMAGQSLSMVHVMAEEPETCTRYRAVELFTPQFEDISGMQDGILGVSVHGKWGFIDETGTYIIEPKYDYATRMTDGIAVVGYKNATEPYVNQETGETFVYYDLYLVDKTGKETKLYVIEEQQYRAEGIFKKDENGRYIAEIRSDMSEDITIANGVVQINDYLFYRYDGSPIIIQSEDQIKSALSSVGSTLSQSRDWLDIYMISESYDGIIPIKLLDVTDRGPVIAYIDLKGNITHTFPCMTVNSYGGEDPDHYGIVHAYAPQNGYSVVYNTNYNGYWNRQENDAGYGVMNADGEFVIAPVYDSIRSYNGQAIYDGTISLQNRDGKWGIMNVNGEIMIPFEYAALAPLMDGYAIAYTTEEDTGTIIDAKGNTYVVADIDGTVLEDVGLYIAKDNGTRLIKTADEEMLVLEPEPVDGVFHVIEGIEEFNIVGSAGKCGYYWVTKTDAGYGIVKIITEEITVVTETEPAETEPAETEPAETEPAETEPAETEPAETEPAETEPEETEPAETEPAETEPEETEPAETEPAETEPADLDKTAAFRLPIRRNSVFRIRNRVSFINKNNLDISPLIRY